MDATRMRRTRDQARRTWYAGHRQRRFARHMGFAALGLGAEPEPAYHPAGRVAITSRAADHGPSKPISRTSTSRP